MKQAGFVVGTVAVIVVGLLIWQWYDSRDQIDPNNATKVLLGGLPESSCPKIADIVLTDMVTPTQIIVERTVALQGCREVVLPIPSAYRTRTLLAYLHIPSALAFQVTVSKDITSPTYSVELGDVDGDNLVDKKDEDLVKSQLFSQEIAKSAVKLADLDGDGRITVADLSLTRINTGVGVKRPDDKPWEKLND